MFLQPREQALLSHGRLNVGFPGWRLAKPLASTVLLAVAMAAAHCFPACLGDVLGSVPNRKAAPRQAPPFATATAFAAGRQALTVLVRLARVAAAASYIVCQSVRGRRCRRQSQDVRDAEQQL